MKTSVRPSPERVLPRGFFAVTVPVLGLIAISPALAKSEKGKGKGNSPDFVPPGLVDKGGVPPGQRRAPVEVVVKAPPPPLRIEAVLARPSPKHVWVPGFWSFETSAYVWMPGAWVLPPEPAAVWVAPRVEARSGVNIFVSGYWKL